MWFFGFFWSERAPFHLQLGAAQGWTWNPTRMYQVTPKVTVLWPFTSSARLTPLGFSFEWDLLLTCPGWIEDLVKTELLEKANAEIKFLWQGRGVLRIKTTADPQYFIDNIRSIHRYE
jgi:hypothetical protein